MRKLLLLAVSLMAISSCSKEPETKAGEPLKIEASTEKSEASKSIMAKKTIDTNVLQSIWAETKDKCASSEAVQFWSSGEYDTGEIAGNWVLNDNSINIKIPSDEESAQDGDIEEVNLKINSLDKNVFAFTRSDGAKVKLIRCETEKEAEQKAIEKYSK